MAEINIIEKLQKLMITTQEEDKQYLNEIIDELQQSKKTRGRPKGSKNSKSKDVIQEKEDIIKNPIGRPKLYTEEEKRIRARACDKRRYDNDPQKKIQMNRDYRSKMKELKNKLL